jgi:hypothetical protein
VTLNKGENMAIMRLWHGRVAIEEADEYEKFMISYKIRDSLKYLTITFNKSILMISIRRVQNSIYWVLMGSP